MNYFFTSLLGLCLIGIYFAYKYPKQSIFWYKGKKEITRNFAVGCYSFLAFVAFVGVGLTNPKKTNTIAENKQIKDTMNVIEKYDENGNVNEIEVSPQFDGEILFSKDFKQFPFSVNYCEVICINSELYVFINNQMYALNGTAISAMKSGKAKFDNAKDIYDCPEWIEDEFVKGTKISLSPITEKGLRLCEK